LSRVKEKALKDSTPSREELENWLRSSDLKCYYSGEQLGLFTLHVDHKQPLVRGGTNALNNLCFASPHMNTAKGNMTEKEFKSLLKLISKWEDKGESLLRRLKQGHFG
jgi:5-methylcytosine-specific restriction endonuclease McrA